MMNDVCLIITKIIFNVYIGSDDNVNITKIKSHDEKLRSKAVLQLTPILSTDIGVSYLSWILLTLGDKYFSKLLCCFLFGGIHFLRFLNA